MRERKKLTIKDIALKANTSKTTVSFYLNGRFEKMSEDVRVVVVFEESLTITFSFDFVELFVTVNEIVALPSASSSNKSLSPLQDL